MTLIYKMDVLRKKKKLLINQFIIYTWSTVARENPGARNPYRSSYNGNIEKFVSSFTTKKSSFCSKAFSDY